MQHLNSKTYIFHIIQKTYASKNENHALSIFSILFLVYFPSKLIDILVFSLLIEPK